MLLAELAYIVQKKKKITPYFVYFKKHTLGIFFYSSIPLSVSGFFCMFSAGSIYTIYTYMDVFVSRVILVMFMFVKLKIYILFCVRRMYVRHTCTYAEVDVSILTFIYVYNNVENNFVSNKFLR